MPFLKDFTQANADISKFLQEINKLTGNGKDLIEIESSENPILKMFDKYAGVDAIQVGKDGSLRGVAVRVQYGRSWNTFTIRYRRSSGTKTEYEKRLDAIRHDKMYPQLTVQCYLSTDKQKILSAAWIKTKDLYRQIIKYPDIQKFNSAGEDGNIFLFVDWDYLYNILIYDGKKACYRQEIRNKKELNKIANDAPFESENNDIYSDKTEKAIDAGLDWGSPGR